MVGRNPYLFQDRIMAIIPNNTSGTSIVTPPTIPITIGASNASISSWVVDKSTKFAASNGKTVLEIPANEQTVKITGKLILNENDEDVGERLKRIEDMLHIPQRSVIMEQKYTKLRELWEEYNETLAAIKTWETIKES